MKKISPIGVTEKRILIYGLNLKFYSSYFDNQKKKVYQQFRVNGIF